MTTQPAIPLDRDSDAPLYLQIAGYVRERIARGHLAVGQRLPSERDFAAALGVNRSTVVSAYDELVASGHVERHVGRGTIVLAAPTGEWSWVGHLPPAPASALGQIMDGFLDQGRIGLEIAEPSLTDIPIARLGELAAAVIEEEGPAAFSYVAAEGIPALRDAVRRRLPMEGEGRALLVTSGAMQGIDLVARALVTPGAEVVVETPTYPGALDALRRAGARLIPVPVDRDGIRTDLLSGVLARGSVRLVLVGPQFQNPSGAVLSPERHEALLAMTRRHGVPVLEDGVYAGLSFDGVPAATLASAPDSDHVIFVSSLSKVLSGGLRIGWVVASPALVDALVAIKQHSDVNTSAFVQHIAARALDSGLVDEHLERMRPIYAERCGAFSRALRERCGDRLRFDEPRGGLSLWPRLQVGGGHAHDFARIASAHGVGIVPGQAFAVGTEQDERFRACFSNRTVEQLEEAAARLSTALDEFEALPAQRGTRRPLI